MPCVRLRTLPFRSRKHLRYLGQSVDGSSDTPGFEYTDCALYTEDRDCDQEPFSVTGIVWNDRPRTLVGGPEKDRCCQGE